MKQQKKNVLHHVKYVSMSYTPTPKDDSISFNWMENVCNGTIFKRTRVRQQKRFKRNKIFISVIYPNYVM